MNNKFKNIALVDCNFDKKCRTSLESFGYELIDVPPHPFLPISISSHPDIQLCALPSGRVIHSDECNFQLKNSLDLHNVKMQKGKIKISANYPFDIPFNVAIVGQHFFHKYYSTDPILYKLLIKEGLQFIDVKQGYSKCSVVVVGPDALITADSSIKEAAEASGKDVLFINDQTSIKLSGYNNGFIGGCTGLDHFSRLFFTGSLATLGNQETDIRNFCNNHNVEVIELSDEPLIDYGSIIFL